MVKARFWGTRGSLTAAANTLNLREKIIGAITASSGQTFESASGISEFIDRDLPFALRGTYGTNTACVEVLGGTASVICDAGTGIMDLSKYLKQGGDAKGGQGLFHIFFSHLHWDHIQGLPFFEPAYMKGNKINLYGCHPEMEAALKYQQDHVGAKASFNDMGAEINFVRLEPDSEYAIAGFRVTTIGQNHPGDSYGYRFEREGKSVVYSTDCEHFEDAGDSTYRFIDFFKDAHLLIIDAQYDLGSADLMKKNWGHSSNLVVVELGVKANVKHLCLFHNEPTLDDAALTNFLEDTKRYLAIFDPDSAMTVDLAYDGLEIEL